MRRSSLKHVIRVSPFLAGVMREHRAFAVHEKLCSGIEPIPDCVRPSMKAPFGPTRCTAHPEQQYLQGAVSAEQQAVRLDLSWCYHPWPATTLPIQSQFFGSSRRSCGARRRGSRPARNFPELNRGESRVSAERRVNRAHRRRCRSSARQIALAVFVVACATGRKIARQAAARDVLARGRPDRRAGCRSPGLRPLPGNCPPRHHAVESAARCSRDSMGHRFRRCQGRRPPGPHAHRRCPWHRSAGHHDCNGSQPETPH